MFSKKIEISYTRFFYTLFNIVYIMAKYFTKEVKIALTVICAIIVLFVGMNFLKGIIVFSDDVSYKVLMKNINGLSD